MIGTRITGRLQRFLKVGLFLLCLFNSFTDLPCRGRIDDGTYFGTSSTGVSDSKRGFFLATGLYDIGVLVCRKVPEAVKPAPPPVKKEEMVEEEEDDD